MMQSIAWSFSSIALMHDSLGSVKMRLIFSSSPLFFGTIKFTPVFCYDYSRIALKDLTYITICETCLETPRFRRQHATGIENTSIPCETRLKVPTQHSNKNLCSLHGIDTPKHAPSWWHFQKSEKR